MNLQNRVNILNKTYSDVDQLRQDAQGWQAQYDQIDRGQFQGKLQLYQGDAIQFSRVNWNKRLMFRGGTPSGSIGFALPMSPLVGEGRWTGVAAGNNDLMAQRSGSDGDFLSTRNRDGFVTSISEAEAQNTLSVLSDEGYAITELMQGIYRLPGPAAEELRSLTRQFSAMLDEYVAGQVPGSVVHRMATQLQKYILWRLVVASEADFKPAYSNKADRVVARAEAFVRSSAEAYIGVLDVCEAIGVSERTLHYAFTKTTGHSPASWMRITRLNEARRRFSAAGPGELLVKQVALDLGFFHQGNFGICYKRQFGEKPSDTLMRSARNVPVLLPSSQVRGSC